MANPHSSLKLSFGQSLKARLGYFWRGIWSTAVAGGIGIPLMVLFKLCPSLLNPSRKPLEVAVAIILIPLSLSAMVVGTILGGLIGHGIGMVQALTRAPRRSTDCRDLKQRLNEIKRDDKESHLFIQTVIREYHAKNGIRSMSSKALMQKLEGESAIRDKMYGIEGYLINYEYPGELIEKIFSPAGLILSKAEKEDWPHGDNKGKRLDNILRETLMKYEDYPTREIRKNTRIFADLKRRGHPYLKGMPKDVLLMITSTIPTEDRDGNPIPAAPRNGEAPTSRLTQQQALDIATETYNNCRQPTL